MYLVICKVHVYIQYDYTMKLGLQQVLMVKGIWLICLQDTSTLLIKSKRFVYKPHFWGRQVGLMSSNTCYRIELKTWYIKGEFYHKRKESQTLE